jgi:hypothetical protein
VALLFEGKGKFIGEWTSIGDKLEHDAILAAVATDEGFATCGYAQAPLNEPESKKQILIRWHGEDLRRSRRRGSRAPAAPRSATRSATTWRARRSSARR